MMSPFASSTSKTFQGSTLTKGSLPLGKWTMCCCYKSCVAWGGDLCTDRVSSPPAYGSRYFRRPSLPSCQAEGLILSRMS